MKNKLYTVAFLAFATLFVGCTDDDLDGMDANAKPTATTSVSSLTILEGRSDVIPFTISQPINVPSHFRIDVVGDAVNADLPFILGFDPSDDDPNMDADMGIPGQGFEMFVPAYADSFEIPVSTFRDLDQTEGSQSFQLRIRAAATRTVLTPGTFVIDLTIEDYEYCLWSFEMFDAYADDWNGGYIDVVSDGESTQYFAMGAGGLTEVPVRKGFDYSFTYVSGNTGLDPNVAGAPSWEEENTYILTSPDGATTFSDGPVPTTGEITSGTATCM